MFLHPSVILFTGGCTPPGRHPSTPLPETATAADGTHPNGMHSCYDSLDPAQHFCARNSLTPAHGLTEGTVDKMVAKVGVEKLFQQPIIHPPKI